MVNAGLPDRRAEIRARPVAPSDLSAVVQLLDKGFRPRRNRRFWQQVVGVLAARPVPAGLPKYGYLLECGTTPVGVLLMIFSTPQTGNDPDDVRCNMSSWYVEPAYRGYAALLNIRAVRHHKVTYLNISAAPATRPVLEAQGWTRCSNGLFVALPALQRSSAGLAARLVAADGALNAACSSFERALLLDHAAHGCHSFWCVTAGRAHPFVFRRRLVKGMLPCAQLIYCRDVADVARFAGLIGRHLLARGSFAVVIDADGKVPGLVGRYFEGQMPKYFKGPARPRLGDLAYTEAALFGI
jgi:hypothetical protein